MERELLLFRQSCSNTETILDVQNTDEKGITNNLKQYFNLGNATPVRMTRSEVGTYCSRIHTKVTVCLENILERNDEIQNVLSNNII